jgi:hypothetical protein
MSTTMVSSCVRCIVYRAERQRLQIEFADGRVYSYSGVPDTLYIALLKAESRGRFFNEMIRNRFPYEKGDHDRKTIRH